MINSREEEAMLADAARFRQRVQEEPDHNAVKLAVQQGMERGLQHRNKSLILTKSSIAGLTVAAVIAILLFIIPILREKTVTAKPPAPVEWGSLESFKEFNTYDINGATFESAVRNKYIQLVGKSAESGGYRITLNAVTADENKIILLYTATVEGDQEVYNVNGSKLKVESGSDYLERSGGMGAHDKILGQDNYHKFYGKSVFELDRTQPFPDQLQADFQIASVDPGKMDDPKTGTRVADMHYSPRLLIDFELDQKFKETATKVLYPDKSFVLGGHEVVLTQLEISPLMIRTRINLKNAAENQWEVRQQIFEAALRTQITSTTNAGVQELPMLYGSGTEDGFMKVFSSNLLDQPKSLVLKIKIKTGGEETEISINLQE